ncbi:protein henna-like isoform X2 [Ptychodera flava]|uniref:protein henna-like isoform X2 n=1 Tax=Ptychodera flava TaxID=63121 RepID=UPI00396A6232
MSSPRKPHSVRPRTVQSLTTLDSLELDVPWFPRKIAELDECASVIGYGSGLDVNHPGFTDQKYRERRNEIVDIGNQYRHGQLLPNIEYTEDEIETWKTVFNKLSALYPTHACQEFVKGFHLLVDNGVITEDEIPQLETVSNFLKERTGFTLRPAGGSITPRDFLAGFAFRVFRSTQYIRHSLDPSFTPEPDVCHELLGHMPLIVNPSFAQFTQEVGLASLGAPDDWITKLAAFYWFTLEVGLCKENGTPKVFGAAVLSSFRELQYCMSAVPKIRPFDLGEVIVHPYSISEMQPMYFMAESFQDAIDKLRQFSRQNPRPFSVVYDAATQTVDVSKL